MIRTLVAERQQRFLQAGLAFAGGVALALLLLRQDSFAILGAVLPVSLAVLVGAGKLASP